MIIVVLNLQETLLFCTCRNTMFIAYKLNRQNNWSATGCLYACIIGFYTKAFDKAKREKMVRILWKLILILQDYALKKLRLC